MNCIIVPGTWAAKKRSEGPRYWEIEGSLTRYLGSYGWDVLHKGRPWWTTELEGSLGEKLWNWIRGRSNGKWHMEWIEGGRELRSELKKLPAEELLRTVIITHSHGLQVALYAMSAEASPRVHGLLSIAGPDRKDMKEQQQRTAAKVGTWLHLQMGDKDNWHWLGTIGSGSLLDTLGGAIGLTKGPSSATHRRELADFDHSEFVNDPSLYGLWPSQLEFFE